MKIYTGFGDSGDTVLCNGEKVNKTDLRVQVYGTLDELNSILGLLRVKGTVPEIDVLLKRIQNELFVLSTEVATPNEKKRRTLKRNLSRKQISGLEKSIDHLSEKLPMLKQFILPGGGEAAALAHVARTVCRRAERLLVQLMRQHTLRAETLVYLNRLSDLLFVIARYFNLKAGIKDIPWEGLK